MTSPHAGTGRDTAETGATGGRRPLPAPLDGRAAALDPRLAPAPAPLDEATLRALAGACASVSASDEARVEAGRDWWPLSVVWATRGVAPALPQAVARPATTVEVSELLRVCHERRIPVTPFAGASGVCGGSLPVHGGLSLDLTGLGGISAVDDISLVVEVGAGTFGMPFETELRSSHRLTAGHWPQSIELSTVGGWIACRGAGQYSTRYGKIEDMVAALEVVLADGRVVRTGARAPRSATGPDLTQLFVGSEGTLGVITSARLRVHPLPGYERRAVYGFSTFEAGLEACRRILRRGATPAVLRLYDPAESARNFGLDGRAVLIVVDEGDPALVDAGAAVVDDECASATRLDDGPAEQWLRDRNHLPPIEDLVGAGLVADTVEVAGTWGDLPAIYRSALDGLGALPGTIAASAHQSHAYVDGACLYFTFAGRPDPAGGTAAAETYYRSAFDAVTAATLRAGGAISHHHGVGINRARYMADHLGSAFPVLQAVKDALDPRGILNPGKLGLADPFPPSPGVP